VAVSYGIGQASALVTCTCDPDFTAEKVTFMSEEKKPTTKVPDGHTPFYTTRQLAPTEKGFVGYETIWKPFQKEAEYETPKQP
jgi:hypothetical protein